MMDLRVKGDVTKRRLIEATERLIAEKGFDAVSVRDITGLAKANVAAVNYHFGSREGLLGAVLEQRMKPLSVERAERLEALGEAATVRQVFEAWAQPLLAGLAHEKMDEATHAKVLGRCLEALAGGVHEASSAAARLVDATMLRLLGERLVTWKSEEIAWKFHFAQGALIHALVHGAGVTAEFRLAKVVGMWIEAMVAPFSDGEEVAVRGVVREAQVKQPRKQTNAAPLRQIAEVVAAAMEVAETSQAEATEESPVGEASAEPAADAEVAKKPAKGKKAKAEDGMGELFLF
jgi:AcrR family transcriptional regulator